MGSDNGDGDEQPVHKVILDAFWIDQTEVTNAMYANCVDSGECNPPGTTRSYTRQKYFGFSDFDSYPVIYVTWSDARTYCQWANRRLPTEAEWEKAARGRDGGIYPWGDSGPTTNLLNFDSSIGDTTTVGSYESGQSPYDVYDMAGNVWEWVSSLYEPYPYSAIDGREDLSAAGNRVLRGGSWSMTDYYVRSSFRFGGDPAETGDLYGVGFRCAMSANP